MPSSKGILFQLHLQNPEEEEAEKAARGGQPGGPCLRAVPQPARGHWSSPKAVAGCTTQLINHLGQCKVEK